MKRTPLRPGKPPPRRTPLAKRNAVRHRRDWLRQFGSDARVKAIQALRCIVPGCRSRKSDNAHTVTRRTGSWKDIFPCCRRHHREQHDIEIKRWAARYNVDPWAVAARLAVEIPA